jgi:hypothetical protein
MRETQQQPDRTAMVLDYFVGPRRGKRSALPWWDESLFTIAGTMALVLVILPVVVVTLSVVTWLLLQL